jgi:shikimate dehydrogenase
MIKLGLIGYPLEHSYSPKIHKAALRACNLDGDYALFPISPGDREGLQTLLERVRSGEILGLNVTIPHKHTVISLLDRLTPTAKAIGAVNTISMQKGVLVGENTDAPGFLSDLKNFLPSKKTENKSALVLGAGGAASAVVYALIHNGWQVSVAARRPEQARELADRYSLAMTGFDLVDLPEISLIINTTPLGMVPDVDSSPWPIDRPFPPNAWVYDLVYNPRETKLVKEARGSGLLARTGLGMLVEQAALAFEIWTGCNPPRNVLFESVSASSEF